MRFIVSDSMELEHGFGKWRYSHDAGVRLWTDGERLCLYYGYSIDDDLDRLVQGRPSDLKHANGKFCVVVLWKEQMQIWIDYFCQSKVYYQNKFGFTVTNQLALLPLTQSDVNATAMRKFTHGIYHRHNDEESFFTNSAQSEYDFMRGWESFTTDHTVFHNVHSIPRDHALHHAAGKTEITRIHNPERDMVDALSKPLQWNSRQLEDTIHRCMSQHSAVVKENYANICSTVSEGVDSVLQDMYFDNASRLMYHPLMQYQGQTHPNPSLAWKRKVIEQFKSHGRTVRLDLMPVMEVGALTEKYATDVNLSFLDLVPTFWQLATSLPAKPDVILYGQGADEMFLHRIRYIEALLPGEDLSTFETSYAGGDTAPYDRPPPGGQASENVARAAQLNLYNRDVENQTGVQTTSLYSDRRIFNLVHRMPRGVLLDSMVHAAPQVHLLREHFGFEFQTPRKDAAGYRCREVLRALLARTLPYCLREHSL